jgi:hypothetical protein
MGHAIQFESVVEGGMIRIPKQFLKTVPSTVKVILAPASDAKIRFAPKSGAGELSGDEFDAVKIDTTVFRFDREEANERR